MKCTIDDCTDDATHSLTVTVLYFETADSLPAVGELVTYRCFDHVGDVPSWDTVPVFKQIGAKIKAGLLHSFDLRVKVKTL